MRTLRRPGAQVPGSALAARSRPVLLVTLGVPFDPDASEFALGAALESGQALVCANVVQIPPMPLSVVMGYDQVGDPPELLEALAAPAQLARSLGIRVERLRVKSMRPIEALLELVAEREPGLLVFGPDRAKLGRRAYRKAEKAIRERAACLVWLAS